MSKMIGKYIYRKGFETRVFPVLGSKILTGDLTGGGDLS